MKPLDGFDWEAIQTSLDREGQANLPELLSAAECDALLEFDAADRGSLGMGNLHALVLGEAWLQRPVRVPDLSDLRTALYQRLVPIANRWNAEMGFPVRNPQNRPHSWVSRLLEGQHQPLSQSAEGAYLFPLQLTILLNQPGRQSTGGELVMTEQRPRMQTRPMVVPVERGGAIVFAVSHRPVRGSKGIYRVNLRHAVSRVRSGNRTALNFVFHHAPWRKKRGRCSVLTATRS